MCLSLSAQIDIDLYLRNHLNLDYNPFKDQGCRIFSEGQLFQLNSLKFSIHLKRK